MLNKVYITQLDYTNCGCPRTEEEIAKLLVLLLRHHMLEEEIHSRRGEEETKVSWELQVGRMGGGERFMESRGTF